MFPIIRQLEEKNVANEIDILLWSDKMDLVAFSNMKGEVALHRLTWTRAWSLAPPKEGITVRAMAWRPDGLVLAIAYSSGSILLINVENKTTIHTIEVIGSVSCLKWIQEKNETKNSKKLLTDEIKQNNYPQYIDNSSIFLPDPPHLANYTTINLPDECSTINFFQPQSEFNVLITGTLEGYLSFRIFGCFSCATVNLNRHVKFNCSVLNVYLSEKLERTYIVVNDNDSNILKLVILDTGIFKTHTRELFTVALKFQQINATKAYVASSIAHIKETWENILLEMDSKLSGYASKVQSGTLSADFLDLLMFGICSDEMQEFLLHDLTKKGLEKFGQTIEMSYTNILRLLSKNVTKIGQSITYHLAELRGMARTKHRYELLGLEEEKITSAISANGSFLIKTGEMQQIINNSLLNYKAFFRWLYTEIIHLMYETVPPEIPKMTQQDLVCVTEFLQNFDSITGDNNTAIGVSCKSGFIMERLGQYLAENSLTILPNMDVNEWDNFLAENECVRNNPMIIKHYKEKSLVQQFKQLQATLDKIFKKSKILIGKELKLLKVIDYVTSDQKDHITFMNTSLGTLLCGVIPQKVPAFGFYVIEFNFNTDVTAKAAYIHLNNEYIVVDVKFYTENYLSVLLQENHNNRTGVIYQCPIVLIREKFQEININLNQTDQYTAQIDGNEFGQNLLKNINMVVSKFSVSGSRRVSIVLSESKKKVMLFEMEGEEEDDEDAEMTNSTIKESDTSMIEVIEAEN